MNTGEKMIKEFVKRLPGLMVQAGVISTIMLFIFGKHELALFSLVLTVVSVIITGIIAVYGNRIKPLPEKMEAEQENVGTLKVEDLPTYPKKQEPNADILANIRNQMSEGLKEIPVGAPNPQEQQQTQIFGFDQLESLMPKAVVDKMKKEAIVNGYNVTIFYPTILEK